MRHVFAVEQLVMTNYAAPTDLLNFKPGGLFREAKRILLWISSVDAFGLGHVAAQNQGIYINQVNVLIAALSLMRGLVTTLTSMIYPALAAASQLTGYYMGPYA